ncbi:MAG TPA: hypothetical protein VFH29_01340, partial [Anaerolineales bacterium]|nr:hypothetical protein [Anaerolineales bacterium]
MKRVPTGILFVAAATLACGLIPSATPPASTPTPVPTTGHLPNVDWLTYTDPAGFSIQHPLTWQQVNNQGDPPLFSLQAAPGTTLLEKYMQIDVTPGSTDCRQTLYGGETIRPSTVTINGVQFLKEAGAGVGAGNAYEWTGYSTLKGSTCITILFVLHSANPGVYSTPPPA